jgi:prephenate dehydrogenase
LFENAFYDLTPSAETKSSKITELKCWLKGTNANFIVMDPVEHDHVTGIVSHLPHLIASSLVRRVKSHAERNERVRWLAAGGFRDITRIASGSPEMWRDIIVQNQTKLIDLINEWIDEMNFVKSLVEAGNREQIHEFFSGAKKFRDSLPVRARGAIDAFYDLYVDIMDQPGAISRVTAKLADEEISLTNIRIIEAREDVFGVLRLSFQTDEDRQRAKSCLEKNGYETYLNI